MEQDGDDRPIDRASTQGAQPDEGTQLRSLAPRYEEAKHGSYVRRLSEAVADPRNRNIALTGRYGTGKSSILDKFETLNPALTLRLAISTLGRNETDDSTTNGIQKELVKQLIYGASPQTLRRSAFSRWSPLPFTRAVLESLALVGLVGLLLGLLGWLPELTGAGADEPWAQRAAVWVLLVGVVTAFVLGIRLLTYGRVVSNVSAAGAAVTLSERTLTYFDKYLDEIVNYFDAQSPDFVILEDLDRFEDPHIFEALRELNTLLNNTPARLKKGTTLRFIYAVRDSLFEKLGSAEDPSANDAAAAETERANRTKFFDVVVPVVPFISHRNARDLLRELLANADAVEISRPLVDLIAQHATDMRLLVNMRNEYLVFAERLLGVPHQAPGLTPDRLFALIADKNFHLGDFEQIARGSSDLDLLYRYRRDLVRTSISDREQLRRQMVRGQSRSHARADVARRLGQRLLAAGETALAGPYQGHRLRLEVGGSGVGTSAATEPTFWAQAVADGGVGLQYTSDPEADGTVFTTITGDDFRNLFPEASDASQWTEVDEDDLRTALAGIDAETAFLRGADFGDLYAAPKYTMIIEEEAGDPASDAAVDSTRTFADLVHSTMKSDLARHLVRRGFLNRNFTLYAAQFYGDFTGPDVATFMVQSVQTNTMDIDFDLTRAGAVENLLHEAGDDLSHSASSYNVSIVDHLLEHRPALASNVVARMVSNFDDQADEFLAAYVNGGTQRLPFAHRLSTEGWRPVLQYLATGQDVPDDIRVELVDAALHGLDRAVLYDIGSEVAEFIKDHFRQMSVFTDPLDDERGRALTVLLGRGGVQVADLKPVRRDLRKRLVDNRLYELTAENLRTATGLVGPVALDGIREHEVVYRYCLDDPTSYFAVALADRATEHVIATPDTLRAVLNDVAATWSEDHLHALANASSAACVLDRLTDVPPRAWPALATQGLFEPSLGNVDTYWRQFDGVDANLAAFLLAAGAVTSDGVKEDTEVGTRTVVDIDDTAFAILNAREFIAVADRVALVRSLGEVGPLAVDKLRPEGGLYLRLLLEAGLVPDDPATFARFRSAGWSAFEPAITASTAFIGFVTPQLLRGMVADALRSNTVREQVGPLILDNLATYVPDDDNSEALLAAADLAVELDRALPADQLLRIGSLGPAARETTLRLVRRAGLATGDIVSVLTALGPPYVILSTQHEQEFEVPYDEDHIAVFGLLKEAGLCQTHKRKSKDLLVVKMP